MGFSNITSEILPLNGTVPVGLLFSTNADHDRVISMSVFVAVLCFCILVGHLLEQNRWVNESIAAILMAVGGHYQRSGSMGSQRGTILVLHQDETPLLYSLVFGEGVVNDATSVVLFNAIQKLDVSKLDGWAVVQIIKDFLYLFTMSTGLGISVSLLTAYAIKALYFGRHSTDREIALMVLMAYFSYLLAELLNFSGILTVFFCGIVMSHYAWYNVSENSRITTKHAFATMSFIAETFIFLYVGMDALDIEKWKMTKTSVRTTFGIYSTILLLVLIGRAAFVFPLSTLSNYMNSSAERTMITFKHQVIIWWAGLMRGAVSIALAFHQFTYSGDALNPVQATMVTVTVIIVISSTVVFGILTKPLINVLLPHHACGNHHYIRPDSPKDDLPLPLLSFEASTSTNIICAKNSISMLLERPVQTIHSYWRKFDDQYMRPIFGGPC
ncbi:sodium/hydrogen exchanger 4 isoform X3 [Magnolia sinica]|uniref:sodium/hydrogen exchanger 4 isoform X3 n=1 Tax=Magnolia sinica TaxID=86752 RepID=UPI0026595BA3|nr:sodium/hydrogen exchanger 4 isoform X3 [Magnolia sinica]